MNKALDLIKLIDNRINIFQSNNNNYKEYPGIVEGLLSDGKVIVNFAGKETRYRMPICQSLIVGIGDSVYFKCNKNDFTNAIVTDVFKKSRTYEVGVEKLTGEKWLNGRPIWQKTFKNETIENLKKTYNIVFYKGFETEGYLIIYYYKN